MKEEDAASSRAVLFAVDEFWHFGDLVGVAHNVPALLDVLTAPDVCSLPSQCCTAIPPDAPPGEVLDTLQDAASEAQHLLLFYYAGHGHHGANGDLLLATARSSMQRAYHSVPYEDVRAIVAGSRARYKVVIIDCCWSGLVHMDGEDSAPVSFDVPGTCVLSSAPSTQKALSQPDGSVFTLALAGLLAEGLTGPLTDGTRAEHLPQLTMEHIYGGLRARLEGLTVGRQKVPLPQMSTRDTGHRIPIARNRAYTTHPDHLALARTAYDSLLALRPAPPQPGFVEQKPTRSSTTAEADSVPCPLCLEPMTYDERLLIDYAEDGKIFPLNLDHAIHPTARHAVLRGAFQKCARTEDREHFVPAPYLTHGQPLTIAMIGQPMSGKTMLLTAMLSEVEQGALEPYGLRCSPLSPKLHERLRWDSINPFNEGKLLPANPIRQFPDIAAGLLVRGPAQTRPVVFFDLAGEDLSDLGPDKAFLLNASAFIFALDPLHAFPLPQLGKQRQYWMLPHQSLGDRTFNSLIDSVPRHGPYINVPVAVALSKSDLLQSEPPVEDWLGKELPLHIGANAFQEETRDAYSFIRHHGSQQWLRPFHHFANCTLHFVTATGGAGKDDFDSHAAKPRRVLAPLLSVFLAAGLLPRTSE